jgi:hypothetical protein
MSKYIYDSDGTVKVDWSHVCPACGSTVDELWQCLGCGLSLAFNDHYADKPAISDNCFLPEPETPYDRHLAEIDRAGDANYLPQDKPLNTERKA